MMPMQTPSICARISRQSHRSSGVITVSLSLVGIRRTTSQMELSEMLPSASPVRDSRVCRLDHSRAADISTNR